MKKWLCCWILALGWLRAQPVLTLEDAVALAVRNNRQIAIGRLDLERAAAATAEAKTNRYPLFHTYLLGGVPLNRFGFTIPRGVLGSYPATGPLPGRDATITNPRHFTGLFFGSATQPVSQLYKIGLLIRQSRLGGDLARENLRERRQEIAHEVRRAYYEVAQIQAETASAEAALQYLTELDELTDRRLAEETVLKSDSLAVKARLSQQRYQLLALRNSLATRQESLNRLLGRDLETKFTVEVAPPPAAEELDLEAARRKALEQRPELRKAKLANAKAELDVKVERAGRIPNFSIQASYLALPNVSMVPQNVLHAGFVLDWEPFDWGRRSRRVEQLEAAAKQSRLTTEDAREQIRLDTGARFRKLAEARALLESSTAAQELEREKLRVLMNRYREQSALVADVLQQQAASAQADARYREAVAGFWTAKADFDRALGEE